MGDVVDEMLSGIRDRLARFDALASSACPEEAPNCSVFELSGLDELLVSRVIAWLLSPKGNHAQGHQFLDALCRHFDIPPPPYRRLEVKAELATSLISRKLRRIDICALDDGWSLGIENKPVAIFQPRQLADYLHDLRQRTPNQAVLVVLKGWEGDLPDAQLEPTGMRDALASRHLINADYTDVQTWLGACASIAQAPYVRFLINDLKRSLQRWLSEGMDMQRQREVATAILNDPDQRNAALELIGSTDCLLKMISDRFVDDVVKHLDGTGLKVIRPDQNKRIDLPRKEFLNIEIDPALPYVFALGFDNTNLRKPYVGLRPRNGGLATAAKYVRVRRMLGDIGVRSRESYVDYWFWWSHIGQPDFSFAATDGVAVWKAMGDGTFAAKLAEIAVRFREHLGAIGALDWPAFTAPRTRRGS